MVRPLVLRVTRPLHARLRQGRCRRALELMQPSETMSLLDVGGAPGVGGEFDGLRSAFGKALVVNLDARCGGRLAQNVEFDVADGCALPYPDSSFDWVFSNAVLEHVGNREKQNQFASEIQRVARVGYFVSTPNRHFLVDPHTYLPFYHFLPDRLQKSVVALSLGHMRQWEHLNLVSAATLREMFPSAEIRTAGPFRMNLIAYEHRAAEQQQPDACAAAVTSLR